MESPKKLVCSSSVMLPYQKAIEVQAWSEDIQRGEENCLRDGYVSSLPEGVCRRLILSGLLCLFSFWALGPFDKFRIWASNLIRFYFIESFSRVDLVIYFVFISYSSCLVIICFS